MSRLRHAASILLLAGPGTAANLEAQDRPSARLGGLNPNLAGVLADPWTDVWRSPARWHLATGLQALYRAGEGSDPDHLETGVAFTATAGSGVALRLHAARDSLADYAYGSSLAAGMRSGQFSAGSRVDVVHDPRDDSSGLATAVGLHAVGEFGSVEIWGEYQAPKTGSGAEGIAGELVLASPDPDASSERLEPVIALRGGRHDVAPFSLKATGPVRWYEALLGLRRRWAGSAALVAAVRRGEWRARSGCAEGNAACAALVDPAVGTHTATALDVALEIRVAPGLWARAGGSWALDGTFGEYEAPWPEELARVGALRPGTVRGAFFGLGARLTERARLDLFGYPWFLSSHGASRRIGRLGVQFTMKL